MRLAKLIWLQCIILILIFNISNIKSQDYFNQDKEGLIFNGKDDIAISNISNFVKNNRFRIDVIVKINKFTSHKSGNNQTRQFIIFKNNSLECFNECFTIYLDEALKSFLVTVASSSGKQIHLSTKNDYVELDKWYHLILVSDGNFLKFYSNGNLQYEKELPFSFDWGNEPLIVGGRISLNTDNYPYDGRLNGSIKMIKIYDYPINATEYSDSTLLYYKNYCIANIENDNDLVFLNKTRTELTKYFSVEISPNPLTENSLLKLNVETTKPFNISLYSSQGRKLAEIYNGSLQKGDHTFEIGHLLQNANSGLYFCKITTETPFNIPLLLIK